MTDTRQALAALLPCPFCGNSKGLAVANENPQDLSGGYFIACPSCDASTGLRFACGEDPIPLLIEQWNRRAALAAQPVAGAVAEPTLPVEIYGKFYEVPIPVQVHIVALEQKAAPAPEPSRSQKMREAGFIARDTRLTCDECGAKFTPQFAPLHECAQPEPSAQAVREPGDPLHDDAYVRGVAVGFAEDDSRRTTLLRIADRMQKLAAAPQPAPSAQAVAHPSHQTVREWMPVSEALRLSDLWTAGDLDNCGQWRAAIKVLADEVRALAASPQPEPSAQGEPVAWISPKDRVPKGGEVVLCLFRDKGIHTALFRGTSTTHGVFEAWHGFLVADLPTDRVIGWVPLASAPSTPPPAVVEAVPLTDEQADALRRLWPAIEKAMGYLVFTAEQAGAVQADMNTVRRGIAPKAAQPVEVER